MSAIERETGLFKDQACSSGSGARRSEPGSKWCVWFSLHGERASVMTEECLDVKKLAQRRSSQDA